MSGYEYTRQLKAKIAESPTHTLDLGDAIAFIGFYGLRNLFNAQGDIRFVGQVAIDVLDRAISENDIIVFPIDNNTRNLTDEETDIYNSWLEAEAETIDEISLLFEGR